MPDLHTNVGEDAHGAGGFAAAGKPGVAGCSLYLGNAGVVTRGRPKGLDPFMISAIAFIPAVLAMGLFATSSVAARRSIQCIGPNNASFIRILLATSFLGVYAHSFGAGFSGPALGWFLASGFIGFGICDTALFLALPRLGAQLTSLIVQCVSVPIGLLTEWLWLGTTLRPFQLAAIGVILTGVVIALRPAPATAMAGSVRTAGTGLGQSRDGQGVALMLGVVAAAGQAWGAVLSRHGTQLSVAAGHPVDGLSVAYQRIWAGVLFTALWWFWQRRFRGAGSHDAPLHWRPAVPWILLNALSGPTLGVACYQWALARQPTGIVMAVTALTPLAVIPLSRWITGERPTRASLVGGMIGIAGVVWLALAG
jgi:drug/metabolite transporter (DMT)-like permease